METKFLDTLSQHLLTNHNVYVYHKAAIDACDLVFDNKLHDETRIPKQVREGLARIEDVLKYDAICNTSPYNRSPALLCAKCAFVTRP